MKIKVVSLNMWWGGELFDNLHSFLQDQKADIVLLQEVYNGRGTNLPSNYLSMQRLQKLDYPYSHFALAYEESTDYGKIPHGNAVLTRFPIKNREVKFMTNPPIANFAYKDVPEHWPMFPAVLQHLVLECGETELNVFNMHGVWDLDGDNYSPARKRMTQTILEQTKDLPNVILAGDTNAKATNKAMRDLEPQLKSVYGHNISTTFNMRRKDNPGYATAAVDLMFVSPNIKVSFKAIPDVDVSDHLPLVVELEIP